MSADSPNTKCMLEENSAAGAGVAAASHTVKAFLRERGKCILACTQPSWLRTFYRNSLISLKGINLPAYSSINAKRIL